ncbi:MAG: tripartite tricarboxylate transporter substrate binding protein [Burkholderiales bacterium]|nr:tripartite tricarboxylate transporter substrate binding protein [Burkholderiales bacterium]
MRNRLKILASLVGALALLPATAPAQPVCTGGTARVVVPFPASGASTDTLARAIAQQLAEMWSQSVVVENRPGAGNVLGTQAVVTAPPDGCTIGVVTSALSINPGLMPKRLPYDTINDIVPVTQLVSVPIGLFANPSLPVRNLPELLAYAKRQANGLTFGSPGVGTSSHMAGAMLASVSGATFTHVPYKGAAPAELDLVGGRIDLMLSILSSGAGSVKSGKIKLIAVATPERDATFPDVASISETLPGYAFHSYLGIIAPKGTPPQLAQRLAADIGKALRSPAVKARLDAYGLVAVGSSPETFGALVRRDIERWAKIIKDNNITAD